MWGMSPNFLSWNLKPCQTHFLVLVAFLQIFKDYPCRWSCHLQIDHFMYFFPICIPFLFLALLHWLASPATLSPTTALCWKAYAVRPALLEQGTPLPSLGNRFQRRAPLMSWMCRRSPSMGCPSAVPDCYSCSSWVWFGVNFKEEWLTWGNQCVPFGLCGFLKFYLGSFLNPWLLFS